MASVQLAIDARKSKEGAADFKAATDQIRQDASGAELAVGALDNSFSRFGLSKKEYSSALNQFRESMVSFVGTTEDAERAFDRFHEELRASKVAIDERTASEKAAIQAERDLARATHEGAEEQRRTADAFRETAGRASNLTGVIFQLVGAIGAVEAARRSVEVLKGFEVGLVEVGEKTHITGGALDDLSQRVLALSTRIPVTAGHLLELAATAGQLGVRGTDNVLQFTETMARLGSTSDVAGKAGAEALGRFLQATRDGIGGIAGASDALNELSDNSSATAGAILEAATRVANSTATFKLAAVDSLALATRIAELGPAGRGAAVAVGESFERISDAIKEGGEKLEALSSITGRSTSEIGSSFANDPAAGFQIFLEGLQRMIDRGQETDEVLKKLGITDTEFGRSLAPLAQRSEDLARGLQLARRAAEEQTAVISESDAKYKTLGGSLDLLRNTFSGAVLSFRQSDGALRALTDGATLAIAQMFGLETANQNASTSVKAVAIAIEGLTAATAAFVAVRIVFQIESTIQALNGLRGAFASIQTFIAANPWTAAAAAIAAVAAAIYTVSEATDTANRSGRGYVDTLQRISSMLAQLPEIEGRLARARAQSNTADETKALQDRQRALEQYSASLHALSTQHKPFAVVADLKDAFPDIDVESLRTKYSRELLAAFDLTAASSTVDQALTELLKKRITAEAVLPDGVAKDITDKYSGLLRDLESGHTLQGIGLNIEQVLKGVFDRFPTEVVPARDAIKLIESEIKGLGVTVSGLSSATAKDDLFGRFVPNPDALRNAAFAFADIGRQVAIFTVQAERASQVRSITDAALSDLQFEIDLIGQDKEAREIAIAVRRYENDIRSKGGEISKDEESRLVSGIRAMQSATKAEEDFAAAKRARNEADKKAAEGALALDAYIQGLQRSLVAQKQSSEQRAVEDAVAKAYQITQKSGIDLTLTEVSVITALVVARERDTQAAAKQTAEDRKREESLREQADALRQLNGAIAQQRSQTNILRSSDTDKDHASFIAQMEELGRAAGLGPEELSAKLKEAEDAYRDLKHAVQAEDLARDIAGSFGDAFDSIILGTESVSDAFLQMGRAIEKALLDALVTKPLVQGLAGSLSGLFGGLNFDPFGSALGNVFAEGDAVKFALGGVPAVYDKPTFFPMANGGIGELGEAGPEAIMPLKRDAEGRLGVSGGGGQQAPAQVHHHRQTIKMTINTPNADSFRRSQRQVESTARRALGRR